MTLVRLALAGAVVAAAYSILPPVGIWFVPLLFLCVLVADAVFGIATAERKFRWAGRHVLITGGSEGLGLAVARVLLEKEDVAAVTLVARSAKKLEAARAQLAEVGKGAVHVASADVQDEAGLAAALASAEAAAGARVSVFVSCAGLAIPKYFEDLTKQDIDTTIGVNLLGTVNCARAFLCRPLCWL